MELHEKEKAERRKMERVRGWNGESVGEARSKQRAVAIRT